MARKWSAKSIEPQLLEAYLDGMSSNGWHIRHVFLAPDANLFVVAYRDEAPCAKLSDVELC